MGYNRVWEPKTKRLQEDIEAEQDKLSSINEYGGVGNDPYGPQWSPSESTSRYTIGAYVPPRDWLERAKQSRMPDWLNQLIPDWSQGLIPQVGKTVPSRSIGVAALALGETGLNLATGLPLKFAKEAGPVAKMGAKIAGKEMPGIIKAAKKAGQEGFDAILNRFGEAMSNPKSKEAWTLTQELRSAERAARQTNFQAILEQSQTKGLSMEESLSAAVKAFKGALPNAPTGLALPQTVKEAAYAKIVKVIIDDPNIINKQFEIAATRTAFDNALKEGGRAIPEIVGTKGGSALTRLQRVFGKDSPLLKVLRNPEELKWSLAKDPENIDDAVTQYLRSLPTRPYGVAKLGEKVPTGLNVALRSKEEIKQGTLELILELSQNPTGEVSRTFSPDKAIKQFQMLPVTARMKVLDTLRKIGVNVVDAIGIPKALKFSIDFSIMARQLGVFGARHPVSWLKTWVPYARAMKSEKIALELDNLVRTEPESMNAIQKLGLDLYDMGRNATYWNRPETMASKIAEKYIPGVRMSNRGAAVAVNYFVADVGKNLVKVLDKMGASAEEYKTMGSLLNELVGRGEMPKFLRGTAGDILNKLLSSPRYTASRFEWPTKLISPSRAVRQEAWSTLFAWATVNAAIITAGVAAGGRVEGDPRSSDVIKLRFGNQRIDLWQGAAQILRLGAQLAPYVDENGNVDWAMGSRKRADGKIVPVPRSEIIGRYFQSKESPGVGALVTILTAKDYVGKKMDFATLKGWLSFLNNTFSPAALEEIGNAYFIDGLGASARSTLGLVGVGVSTYESDIKKATSIKPTPRLQPSRIQPSSR